MRRKPVNKPLVFVLTIALLVLSMPALVTADVTPDGFVWVVNGDNATITGYSGSETAIVIPNEIAGYAVTSIEASAFAGNTGLASVQIPAAVSTIGDSAFSGCTSLASVILPGIDIAIGVDAFTACAANLAIFGSSGGSSAQYALDHSILFVSGVTPGGNYSSGITINFNLGTATLNGEAFTSGGTFSTPGNHSLVFLDDELNETAIGFTITASYTVNFDSQGGSAVDSIPADHGSKIAAPAEPVLEGYTFGGWFKEAECTTAWDFDVDTVIADTILYAKWTINAYTVTFDSQGGSAVDSIPADYGSEITAPAEPILEGYTFGGWFKEAACTTAWDFTNDTVTADITLYAKWTINAYTVTFDSQGGSAVAGVPAEHGSKISVPSEPTREGHIFGGWFKEAACTTAWDFSNDTVTADIILYAKWTIISYTVTFDSQGGSAVDSIPADHGNKITEPAEPVLEGCAFGGWFKEAACTTAWNFAVDTVTADITLYAKWTINSYTVTFDSQGGSAIDSLSADHGTTITKPSDPTREGHAFGGWFKEAACTTAWDFTNNTVTADVTLYAKWTINDYSVTFDSQGGSQVDNIPANYDTKIAEPAEPTLEGYTFGGWYIEAECTTAWDFDVDTVKNNITLYAKWTINSYTVTYDSQGGSSVDSISADHGTTLATPAEPVWAGHTFGGWFTDAQCTSAWVFDLDTVTKDITLYAKWTINSYTVTFDSQGGSAVDSLPADYDSTLTAPAEPDWAGHTFGGWFTDSACTIAWDFGVDTVTADITLYAKWTINSYTVTFDSQGGSAVDIVTADYGTKIPEPTAPVRTEHVFGGWFKDAACTSSWNFTSDVVSGNTVLYAKWTINQYTLTFDSQGGSAVTAKKVDYNTTTAAPAAPSLEGYSFGGWFREASCTTAWNFSSDVVTINITLYAKWTINTYTVTFDTQGGSGITPASAVFNTTVAEPAAPSRSGYLFIGWYTSTEFNKTWSFTSDVVKGDTTLYTRWLRTPADGLSAVSGGYNGVRLTWNPTSGADHYEIYRATSSSGTYSLVTTVTDATYTDTGLSTNKTYYFKFRAYSTIGSTIIYSGFSSYAQAKPVPAVPESFGAYSASYNSVRLTWAQVPGASGYRIYRATSSSGKYSLVKTITKGGTLGYTNSGRTSGRTYYYKIRAYRWVNKSRIYSSYSAVISCKPLPAVPGSFNAAVVNGATVKLTWARVGGSYGYQVYRSTAADGSYSLIKTITSSKTLSFTNAGLTTGTEYSYMVRAYRTVSGRKVYGNFTSVASVTPMPGVPGNYTVARTGATSIKVAFSEVAAVTGYEIYRSVGSSDNFELYKTLISTALNDIDLTTGTTYYYKVRSFKIVGSNKFYGTFTSAKSATP